MIRILIAIILAGVFTMSHTDAQQSFHDFTMTDIDGTPVKLSQFKGKVVLVVNVASFCGYTKQYKPLQELYAKYKGQGFVIVGIPANDFGAQEPGTDEEIKEFCSTKYDVTFPMMSKVTVKGSGKHPLYTWLTASGGEVGWNFEKFLIGKDGKIIARYKSGEDPMGSTIQKAVSAALGI